MMVIDHRFSTQKNGRRAEASEKPRTIKVAWALVLFSGRIFHVENKVGMGGGALFGAR